MSRWTTPDPLAEKYYSFSPYAFVGNNPVNRIDPDGRDWYWINDEDGTRTLHFDPNITKDSKLSWYEEYAGTTFTIGTGTYREDGSIMFTNETDAYNRMWSNANRNDKEELGIIMNGGVLVLPSYLNTRENATPSLTKFGYEFKNGLFYDAKAGTSGAYVDYIATIHTHQNPFNYYQNNQFSEDDVRTFSSLTPNKPYLAMDFNNTISVGINKSTTTHRLNGFSLQSVLNGFGLTNALKNR